MKRAIGPTVLSLFGSSVILLSVTVSERASAQDCTSSTPCVLFEEQPAFFTGPTTSILEATRFDVKAQQFGGPSDTVSVAIKEVEFDSATQTAKVAGSSDGTKPIAIDNFMVINGTCSNGVNNICADRPEQSCFDRIIAGDLLDDLLTGRQSHIVPRSTFINEVLGRIPPVDVSSLISSGQNRFTLCDAGSIAGNFDLFLVITDRPVPPPLTRPECLRQAAADFETAVGECQAQFANCDPAFTNCEEVLTQCLNTAREVRIAREEFCNTLPG